MRNKKTVGSFCVVRAEKGEHFHITRHRTWRQARKVHEAYVTAWWLKFYGMKPPMFHHDGQWTGDTLVYITRWI